MVVNFFDDAKAEADEADRTIENLNGDEVEEVFIIFIRDLHKFFFSIINAQEAVFRA